MIEMKIKTWSCGTCGYRQDFEPTKENMQIHFKEFPDAENKCPSCLLKGSSSPLKKETDPAKKIVIRGKTQKDVDKFKELKD